MVASEGAGGRPAEPEAVEMEAAAAGPLAGDDLARLLAHQADVLLLGRPGVEERQDLRRVILFLLVIRISYTNPSLLKKEFKEKMNVWVLRKLFHFLRFLMVS